MNISDDCEVLVCRTFRRSTDPAQLLLEYQQEHRPARAESEEDTLVRCESYLIRPEANMG